MTDATPSRRMQLRSLLITFESELLHLYELEHAASNPENFEDIDVPGSLRRALTRIADLREQILAYAEKD